VLAWLGLLTHDSNYAITILQRIENSIDIDLTSLEIRAKDIQWKRENGMASMYFRLLLDLTFKLPCDHQESQASERLCFQLEFTLGAERVVLTCGPSSIPSSDFREAAIFLNKEVKGP